MHRVALVAAQALLLAGDEVEVEVTVDGPHVLHVVEVGGTVAYDMRGGQARWAVSATLRGGARVAWHGEPFVVAAGADVHRTTTADLDGGSRLALRETLVLGRTGERGSVLRTRARLDLGGVPAVAEDLDLTPEAGAGPAVLGPHRCIDSVTILGHRLPDSPGTTPDTALLQAEAEASVARWLGADLHRSPLGQTWRHAVSAYVPPAALVPSPPIRQREVGACPR